MTHSKAPVLASVLALMLAALTACSARAQYVLVDFTPHHNWRLQNLNSGYPSGAVSLGGVPFSIPASGNNMWAAYTAGGANPRFIEIATSVSGVKEVHTLINTYWGQPGPDSYASIEFFGSAGAYYKKSLVGNDDIRDHFSSSYTNSINGTTTTEVFTIGGHRLDKQAIALPADFHTQTLTKIKVSDSGDTEFQRIFLAGITAVTKGTPVTISAFTISPNLVVGGRPTKGTIKLSTAAPAGGGQVDLTGWDASAATGPTVVLIPAGKTSATFTIRTVAVTTQKTLNITATSANSVGPRALTVNPINVKVVTNSADGAVPGDKVLTTVVLDAPATERGISVKITSSNAKVLLPNGTQAETITIPAGQASASVSLSILAGATGSAAIKGATVGGTKTVSGSLTLYAP